jgi:hypothetical protein
MRSLSMQSLTGAIKRRHPGVVIYGIGDAAHRLRTSDHNEDDTPGSLAAQSDADNNPEHRGIDVMLGPAFTRAQAYALIADLLRPESRARLFYILFDGWRWSRSTSWAKVEFDGDPHDDHIHISGHAADDENAAPWPAVYGGDMAITDADATKIAVAVWSAALGTGANRRSTGVILQDAADESDIPVADIDESALADELAPELVAEIQAGLVVMIRQVVREELDKTRLLGG